MAQKAIRPNGEDAKFGAGRDSTITDTLMKEAFIYEEKYAIHKIEEVGKLNRETLRDLGARIIRR